MIKINKLSVSNFKSLYKTEIEKFGPVNLFYGFNNSGKSNIFKFIDLLFRSKVEYGSVDYEDERAVRSFKEVIANKKGFWNGKIRNESFLFNEKSPDSEIKFKIILEVSESILIEVDKLKSSGFILDDTKNPMISFEGRIVAESVGLSQLEVTSARINDKEFYRFEDSLDLFFEGIDVNSGLDKSIGESILNSFNDCVMFIDTDRNFRKEDMDGETSLGPKTFKNWLYNLYIDSETHQKFRDLEAFLESFEFTPDTIERLGNSLNSFPFSAGTKIGFAKIGSDVEIMLENSSGRLPVSSFGTGIQQFFYLMSRIFMNSSRIIIVEELELNLAPIFQKELLRFLRKSIPSNCDQILFSSHSPFFTMKDSNLVDIVQFVQINNSVVVEGTTVESHEDWEYHDDINQSYFSLLFC